MPIDQNHLSLWGQLFEIAVKRGVLTTLIAQGQASPEHPSLRAWHGFDTADVYGVLARELGETDPNQKAITRAGARHLFDLGMGLGQTVLREYLRRLPSAEDYRLRALWCPWSMPSRHGGGAAETTLAAFLQAFDLEPQAGDGILTHKGYPARADCLLWLEPRHPALDRQLLCLEISLNGLPEDADYRSADSHLQELETYAAALEARGVFSRVCTEVSGEEFQLSPRINQYLPAFSARDKPLYKLCQAASYVHTLLRWLHGRELAERPWRARALSVTRNGFESLSARYFPREGEDADPRVALLASLGRAYRDSDRQPEFDPVLLRQHIRAAFEHVRASLPKPLRRSLRKMAVLPEPGRAIAFDLREQVEGFLNPMSRLEWAQAQHWLEDDAALAALFGQEARTAVTAALTDKIEPGQPVPLRDLHAAAVVAGIRAARPGRMRVLGLEGNPGIGKTTAVVGALQAADTGFLFIYVSPRVVINDDVTRNLARRPADGEVSGILSVTTHSRLIATARNGYEARVAAGIAPPRRIDGAVVADGVHGLRPPDGSILILSPEEKAALEQTHVGARSKKRAETERRDRIDDVATPGVLATLAATTRGLLRENPGIRRAVLTAAIQGYKDSGGKTTVRALSRLFAHAVGTAAGLCERREFARRMPAIVVMVDELTGDGAGALFVHEVAGWLDEQFLWPFSAEADPPFRVILAIADASLANEIVLDRYLNSGNSKGRAPDKVLVAPSGGQRPFRLAASSIRIGGARREVLHVMTNSYPAAALRIDYRIRLDPVRPARLPNGEIQSLRQAIADRQATLVLGNSVAEIARALKAEAGQIIFFAQDKAFLREVQTALVTAREGEGGALLPPERVAILDSSIPAARRADLLAPEKRDAVKLFLMTSSGARGVSFPKTDWIIALLPRFNVEAALMEVAQLIYRGRGANYRGDGGGLCTDGDWKTRRLVMLVQDYLPETGEDDLRRWLRQASDLLTFLVMLRATLHTRIGGDAGLEAQRLALVPVGGIGFQEILSLMSGHVQDFLQECEVYFRDIRGDREVRGLVAQARRQAEALFAKFSLDATAVHGGFRSMSRLDDWQAFSRAASADNAPLLPDLAANPALLLPEHVYCVGPFWLEHWGGIDKQERFSIEGWSTDVGGQIRTLFGCLRHIQENPALPTRLRTASEELYRILARDRQEAVREFSTVKALRSPFVWVALPLGYGRFWKKDDEGRWPCVNEHGAAWRNALGRCLGGSGMVLPVVPRYAGIPYALRVGEPDPARLDFIFDDRYLAVSDELNLLNTILLAGEGGGKVSV